MPDMKKVTEELEAQGIRKSLNDHLRIHPPVQPVPARRSAYIRPRQQ